MNKIQDMFSASSVVCFPGRTFRPLFKQFLLSLILDSFYTIRHHYPVTDILYFFRRLYLPGNKREAFSVLHSLPIKRYE